MREDRRGGGEEGSRRRGEGEVQVKRIRGEMLRVEEERR